MPLPNKLTNGIQADADKVMENLEYLMANAGKFCIWAEENSALSPTGGSGADGFQWAFGNGSDTPDGSGIVLPEDCELYAITAEVVGGTGIQIAVYKNTTNTKQTNVFSTADNKILTTTTSFEAGDIVNFRTLVVGSGGTSGRVTAWFRGLN